MKRVLTLFAALLLCSGFVGFTLPGFPPLHKHATVGGRTTRTTTLTISGVSNVTYNDLDISTTSGDCIDITNSTNVTIKASRIGPCGTNNSTAASNGINISGSSTVNIYDNYIHVENLASACCDTHLGIKISNASSGIDIEGNVLAYNESNIDMAASPNGTNHVTVNGNFMLNPRGPFPRGQNFQSWGASAANPNTNMTVTNNYTLSSTDTGTYTFAENQEDSINFGFTNTITATGNYIVGGHSGSGCGLIADESANSATFQSNKLSNTGQCGIGIASGTNQLIDSNKILNTTPVSGAGNTGIYVWNQNPEACGPVTVSNNVDSAVNFAGTPNSYWNGGGCGTVTLTGNTFDTTAKNQLNPMSTTNPPPLIPPLPFGCVALSPYSTQTSKASC